MSEMNETNQVEQQQEEYTAQDQQANANDAKKACCTCCCDYVKWSFKAAWKMCQCTLDLMTC